MNTVQINHKTGEIMNNLSIVRNKIPTPTQKAVIPKVGPGVLPDAAQKVGKDIKDATCVKEACGNYF